MIKAVSYATNLLCLAAFLSSCTVDPSAKGSVAPAREDPWIPCKKPIYLIEDPCAAEIEEEDCAAPLTLCSLVDYALKNNPQTAISWSQARSAAYSWEASKSLYYPQIDLQDSYTWQDLIVAPRKSTPNTNTEVVAVTTPDTEDSGSTGFVGGVTQVLFQQVTATYLLWDFGGRDAAAESTRQALVAANWTHNRTIQTVIFNVLQTYYQYIAAKALVKARMEDLENAKMALAAAEAQFEAGINTKVDYLQAKANFYNAELQLQAQRGQERVQLGQLMTAVGLPANTNVDVSGMPQDLPVAEISHNLDQLIAIAKQERPDLEANYAAFFQKESDYHVAYSAIFPTLTAEGTMTKTNNITFPSLNQNYYSAVITLNFPIFSGYFYENEIRKAYQDMETAYANILNTEEQVYLDVVTSYNNFKTAQESLVFAREFLAFSQEAFDATLLGYRMGTKTIVDVLNATASLSTARTQIIQYNTQWAISLSNIAYSAGFLSDSLVCPCR